MARKKKLKPIHLIVGFVILYFLFSGIGRQASCVDSDGGKVYNVKGTASGGTGDAVTDCCVNSDSISNPGPCVTSSSYLKEAYCSSYDYPTYEIVDGSCNDGVISGGGGGGGGGCTPDWMCSDWSDCVNNVQTRDCVDINNCNDNTGKPTESQSCSSSSTNTCTDSDNGLNYKTGGSVTTVCDGTSTTLKDTCIDNYNMREMTCDGFDPYVCAGMIVEKHCITLYGQDYECQPYPPTSTPAKCVYVGSGTESCTETDGGPNYAQKGTMTYTCVNGNSGSKIDSCVDSNTLNEYLCDGADLGSCNINPEVKSCGAGYECQNGACVYVGGGTTCTNGYESCCDAASTCGTHSQNGDAFKCENDAWVLKQACSSYCRQNAYNHAQCVSCLSNSDCSTGQVCSSLGQCCTPKTCAGLAYNCGTHSDGCGEQINCGTCNSGYDCVNGHCQVSTTVNVPDNYVRNPSTCGNGLYDTGEDCLNCVAESPCRPGGVCSTITRYEFDSAVEDAVGDEEDSTTWGACLWGGMIGTVVPGAGTITGCLTGVIVDVLWQPLEDLWNQITGQGFVMYGCKYNGKFRLEFRCNTDADCETAAETTGVNLGECDTQYNICESGTSFCDFFEFLKPTVGSMYCMAGIFLAMFMLMMMMNMMPRN